MDEPERLRRQSLSRIRDVWDGVTPARFEAYCGSVRHLEPRFVERGLKGLISSWKMVKAPPPAVVLEHCEAARSRLEDRRHDDPLPEPVDPVWWREHALAGDFGELIRDAAERGLGPGATARGLVGETRRRASVAAS